MKNVLKTLEHRSYSQPALEAMANRVVRDGFLFFPGRETKAQLTSHSPNALKDWQAFEASWNDMPRDPYMADGGRYRYRRHAILSAAPQARRARLEPHGPHYQSLAYNALNGGVARHYEAIAKDIVQGNTMSAILAFCGDLFSRLAPAAAWRIEVHQFRIEAVNGKAGQPTPEGMHRDGVNYVLVMMVKRANIARGTTTIHGAAGDENCFTLTDAFDAAIVDDERCTHGVTPVIQVDPNLPAYRDVLVVTFRRADRQAR